MVGGAFYMVYEEDGQMREAAVIGKVTGLPAVPCSVYEGGRA